MAGEFEKPNKVHTLFPEEIREKMWPLPVRELFLVGGASEQKLKSLGINTIGELAQAEPGMLRAALKKHGEAIWNFANGRDVALVEAEPSDNKGYGNSVTIAFDVTDGDTAKNILLSLSETVGRRLRRDEVWIETVSVTIRYFDLKRWGIYGDVMKDAIDIFGNTVFTRTYDPRMELWPISPYEIERSPALSPNNPGW